MEGRLWRRVRMACGALVSAFGIALLVWLKCSTVVLTSGGVYDAILLPIGSGAIRWRADQSTIAAEPRLGDLHGPVVTRLADGRHAVSWFCHDRVTRDTTAADSTSIRCNERTTHWGWRAPAAVPLAVHPAVDRVAAVSDLEGDTTYFGTWGRTLGVLDSAGHWAYGTGHVVIVGDITDRGRWVYPLLWTLYRLDGEATAAGGALHVVLGNHEQYDLVGITKDVETEHHFAMRQIGAYHTLLDTTTVLGQWLRTRPVALQLGRTLFVHGGVSPDIVAAQLTVDSLNRRSRDFLFGRSGIGRSRDEQLGRQSVTQYRGFVMALDDQPLADSAHVNRALAQFDVGRIVIGHTEVDSISTLHGGRVIDINATLFAPQALVLDRDIPRVVPMAGPRRAWSEPAPVERRFELLNLQDWRALIGVFSKVSG